MLRVVRKSALAIRYGVVLAHTFICVCVCTLTSVRCGGIFRIASAR